MAVSPPAPKRAPLTVAVHALTLVLAPFALFVGVRSWGPRRAAVVVAALVAVRLATQLVEAPPAHRLAVAKLPVVALLAAAFCAWTSDARFLLTVPALTSVALFGFFAASLRTTPLVEKFARMQKPELSADEVAYCRRVTVAWCLFLAANAATIVGLAFFASADLWAVYTGFVSYVLVGGMLAGEYIWRKARFREYSDRMHDRLLARIFPPLPRGE